MRHEINFEFSGQYEQATTRDRDKLEQSTDDNASQCTEPITKWLVGAS